MMATLPATSPVRFLTVFVTGGDGFVGSHFVPALAQQLGPGGRLVTGTRHPDLAGRNGIFFDLCQPDSVRAAIAEVRPDAIVHLAAQASVAGSAGAAANTWSVNAVGSLALAEAVAANVPDCTFLFASSAEVYGATFNTEIATTTSIVQPQSSYARSKAAAEAMLDDVLPSSARLIVARPANHSGRGQTTAFVIPSFASQIALAEKDAAGEVLVGQLDSRRDFLDVADVVDAYTLLLAKADDLPSRSVFNIASGNDVRIGDLLTSLLAMAVRPIEVRLDDRRLRPSEVPSARIDNSAVRQFGWEPSVPLETTLAAVLAEQRAIVAGRTGNPTP